MRNALRLYQQCIDWQRGGNTFAIVTPSGDIVPVKIFVEQKVDERPKLQVIEGGKPSDPV